MNTRFRFNRTPHVLSAFAALGMGLNGMLTAFWLPPLVHALL